MHLIFPSSNFKLLHRLHVLLTKHQCLYMAWRTKCIYQESIDLSLNFQKHLPCTAEILYLLEQIPCAFLLELGCILIWPAFFTFGVSYTSMVSIHIPLWENFPPLQLHFIILVLILWWKLNYLTQLFWFDAPPNLIFLWKNCFLYKLICKMLDYVYFDSFFFPLTNLSEAFIS